MKMKTRLWLILVVILGVGFGCQLTSPRPASWSGTPTAKARALTSTAIAITQGPIPNQDLIVTPTEDLSETNPTRTPQPTEAPDGPWLVYPAHDDSGITAYDVDTKSLFDLDLPEPIYWEDLQDGLSPDGKKLILRAGSATETDQLGLYQIDLLSKEVTQVTPLLSLLLQRRIVNQEGTLAFDVLEVVTRPEALAWSPDSRYLAFSAALDNQTSDLYIYDSANLRVTRMNGLPTHNATPYWGLDNSKVVSQELGRTGSEGGWRAENVTGVNVPEFDNQNTLYVPISKSQGEVFVGWLNAQTFISYSLTSDGPSTLRQVNIDTFDYSVIQEGSFEAAALDPASRTLAMILNSGNGMSQGMVEGIYLFQPGDVDFQLLRGGIWNDLSWEPGGMFIASGPQGLFVFNPEGETMVLPDEVGADLSPMGNWMIAWGDGARLYQPPSIYPLQTITENLVETIFWQPDSRGFFIQSEGALYSLRFPGLSFDLVEDGFSTETSKQMAWVISDLDE
jgi:hypothetical protein